MTARYKPVQDLEVKGNEERANCSASWALEFVKQDDPLEPNVAFVTERHNAIGPPDPKLREIPLRDRMVCLYFLRSFASKTTPVP